MLIAEVMIDITKIQTFDVPPSLKTLQVAKNAIDGKYKLLNTVMWVSGGVLLVCYLYHKRKKNDRCVR
jgi:hypothetical protein